MTSGPWPNGATCRRPRWHGCARRRPRPSSARPHEAGDIWPADTAPGDNLRSVQPEITSPPFGGTRSLPGRVNRMWLTRIVDSQHRQRPRWCSSGTTTAMPRSSRHWATRSRWGVRSEQWPHHDWTLSPPLIAPTPVAATGPPLPLQLQLCGLFRNEWGAGLRAVS